MRHFASCHSDRVVSIVSVACSSDSAAARDPSSTAQSGVTCLYRARLASSRELLIGVTWTKSLHTISLDDFSSTTNTKPSCWKGSSIAVVLRKKKGSRSFQSGGGTMIRIYWDVSMARYYNGLEPSEGFYLVVLAGEELALLLGDLNAAAGDLGRFVSLPSPPPPPSSAVKKAEFWLVGRREQVLGKSFYCTRAKFCDGGRDHEVTIRCKGDGGSDKKESELWVSIDGKKVVEVRHLQWNFRGNQTIFIDGWPVDMMWDVHDWWFTSQGDGVGARGGDRHSGKAVFMFRRRSALENRLWLEEDQMLQRGGRKCGFSHLIHAFELPN